MNPLFVNNYVDKLKNLAAQHAEEDVKGANEYRDIVEEIRVFLNEERKGTPYPELDHKRVSMLVGYIWTKGGAGDLRKFRDDVRSKGAWFFWWIVKPKKDPGQKIK